MNTLKNEYDNLKQVFGLSSRCWDMIHIKYSQYKFCDANKKALIAEYLIWEEFTQRAKQNNFSYYYGIDEFLASYKDAVYSHLTNLGEP